MSASSKPARKPPTAQEVFERQLAGRIVYAKARLSNKNDKSYKAYQKIMAKLLVARMCEHEWSISTYRIFLSYRCLHCKFAFKVNT